jgi:hypothetical protein
VCLVLILVLIDSAVEYGLSEEGHGDITPEKTGKKFKIVEETKSKCYLN